MYKYVAKQKMVPLFRVVLFFLLFPAVIFCQNGTLKGMIAGPGGSPGETDSIIRLEHWGANEFNHDILRDEKVIHPDKDGRYTIDLIPGTYDVFLSSPLSSPVAKRIKVKAGGTVIFNRRLRFAPDVKLLE